MKLEEISIMNYRQFEKANVFFDNGITVLAGANNSGKTSLITLIKNVFNDEKSIYCDYDSDRKLYSLIALLSIPQMFIYFLRIL